MYRITSLLGAVVFMAMAPATRAAAAWTAEALAARNVTARGGIETVRALQSLRLTGRMLVNDGTLRYEFVELIKRPSSVRLEATLQGLTKIQAYDGQQAWQIDPFQGRKDAERLSSDDAKALAENVADFAGPLTDYAAKGYALDYLGTEDIDGTEAHKLRLSRANGDILYVYLDPEQFLEIRTISRRIEHGVPRETVTDYGDYERVNGAYLALALESGPKGSTSRRKLQIDKAEANIEAADSLFQFPGAVAAAGK